MTNQVSSQSASVQAARAPAATGSSPGVEASQLSAHSLQTLIDQTACFNTFVVPDRTHPGCAVHAQRNGGDVIGVKCGGLLHRFDIELDLPTPAGVRATNILGEVVGHVEMRWMVIPNTYAARPDVEPPPTPLDPSRSQRFAMQEMTFTFGEGPDGFRGFGTGRTFPVASGGRPRIIVEAVGNMNQGMGKFDGHEGTFTLCGELTPEGGFAGHIIARIVDEQGNLRTRDALPPGITVGNRSDNDFTYLMWLAQKGSGPEQQNRPSLTPDGQLRGLNIAVELKRGHFGFTTSAREGFRNSELRVGEVIGLEEGFGRGSQPDPSPEGTALNPFQFEGVARYSFCDRDGQTVGSIVTNVLEGRRFDFRFAGVPNKMSWRFGFFGPIIYGSGCFRGVEGMFYGASHSFFDPPPGAHIITHCYFARVYDPEAKFRCAPRSGSS